MKLQVVLCLSVAAMLTTTCPLKGQDEDAKRPKGRVPVIPDFIGVRENEESDEERTTIFLQHLPAEWVLDALKKFGVKSDVTIDTKLNAITIPKTGGHNGDYGLAMQLTRKFDVAELKGAGPMGEVRGNSLDHAMMDLQLKHRAFQPQKSNSQVKQRNYEERLKVMRFKFKLERARLNVLEEKLNQQEKAFRKSFSGMIGPNGVLVHLKHVSAKWMGNQLDKRFSGGGFIFDSSKNTVLVTGPQQKQILQKIEELDVERSNANPAGEPDPAEIINALRSRRRAQESSVPSKEKESKQQKLPIRKPEEPLLGSMMEAILGSPPNASLALPKTQSQVSPKTTPPAPKKRKDFEDRLKVLRLQIQVQRARLDMLEGKLNQKENAIRSKSSGSTKQMKKDSEHPKTLPEFKGIMGNVTIEEHAGSEVVIVRGSEEDVRRTLQVIEEIRKKASEVEAPGAVQESIAPHELPARSKDDSGLGSDQVKLEFGEEDVSLTLPVDDASAEAAVKRALELLNENEQARKAAGGDRIRALEEPAPNLQKEAAKPDGASGAESKEER